jgi:hypothetical protein
MAPLGWHVTARLYDDRVITPSTFHRRRLARSLLRIGQESGLLAFAVADTHLHAIVVCDRETAGRFAWRIELSAQGLFRFGVPFEPARLRPIADQKHLSNAFWYVLRQQQRHDIEADPHFDGSSLPDLVGLRVGAPWLLAQVRSLLPRVRGEGLRALLGNVDLTREPADLVHLRSAATSAACVADLGGRSDAVVAARVAAVHLAGSLTAVRVAALLGLDAGTVRRLRRRRPDPALIAAIRRQLALREQLAANDLD